ncbi:MAG: shikimate dehydrogenase [Elusimicrobiota bacterium]|nr:shikimate dehydrogenase [Elusimicrobiota bacterium]
MEKSSATHICWLIGHPVEHSLSPGMHKVLYEDMGVKGWEYRKKDLKDEIRVKKFVKNFISEGETGFNVTVPYKEAIIKLIDETDKSALEIGAVNTVKNDGGTLKGYNTDWTGFRDDLKDSLGVDICGDALVLGAGGAGRAIVYALAQEITSGIVYIYDKDTERARLLAADMESVGNIKTVDSLGQAELRLAEAELLVNAAPVGMKPGLPVINIKPAREELKVYDVVYNRETELIRDARQRSLQAVTGEGMLAGQGANAFYIWSDGRYGEVKPGTREKMKEYVTKEVNNQ